MMLKSMISHNGTPSIATDAMSFNTLSFFLVIEVCSEIHIHPSPQQLLKNKVTLHLRVHVNLTSLALASRDVYR